MLNSGGRFSSAFGSRDYRQQSGGGGSGGGSNSGNRGNNGRQNNSYGGYSSGSGAGPHGMLTYFVFCRCGNLYYYVLQLSLIHI